MPLVNEFTCCRYEWVWVRTYGGEIDIVIHPDPVKGKRVPGGLGWAVYGGREIFYPICYTEIDEN